MYTDQMHNSRKELRRLITSLLQTADNFTDFHR